MTKQAGETTAPTRSAPLRRPVEESLGEALIRSIDAFVFRDIENEAEATDVFAFIADPGARAVLGRSLLGARWHQKAGLALARDRSHPAHGAVVRSQVIEYGALVELMLFELLRTRCGDGRPTFEVLIARAAEAGILSEKSANAAHRRREARNGVHLDANAEPLTGTSSAKALADFKLIVNECRTAAGLAEWVPARPGRRPS